ncbi:MAG TPA: nuclear transport factor 2 family protein [Gemmatimonadaceae bacterium]|nr:nuclear transport factor 2 family protein [Gemmatimonadaceae bacterium]
MRITPTMLLALLTSTAPITIAACQSGADSAAIKQTALDYIQGWYGGDAARMERALHPELAKRIVRTDTSGNYRLDQQSAMTLVQSTRFGGGKQTPAADQHDDVRILDIYRNAASVRIDASYWVDYLQVAKWRGRWVIVNVLWELKPKT